MKVLVATTQTQGQFEGDYFHGVDGELVYVQNIRCADPRCRCALGFTGMGSSRATTTAKVVDRPELTTDGLAAALAESLSRDRWFEHCDDETARETVCALLTLVSRITGDAEVDTLVRRDGDLAYLKLEAG